MPISQREKLKFGRDRAEGSRKEQPDGETGERERGLNGANRRPSALPHPGTRVACRGANQVRYLAPFRRKPGRPS